MPMQCWYIRVLMETVVSESLSVLSGVLVSSIDDITITLHNGKVTSATKLSRPHQAETRNKLFQNKSIPLTSSHTELLESDLERSRNLNLTLDSILITLHYPCFLFSVMLP